MCEDSRLFPFLYQYLFSVLLMMAILVAVRWHLVVAWIVAL